MTQEIASLEQELIEMGTSRDVLRQTRDAVRSAVNVARLKPSPDLEAKLPSAAPE